MFTPKLSVRGIHKLTPFQKNGATLRTSQWETLRDSITIDSSITSLSRVVSVLPVKNIVIVLTAKGQCSVFHRGTGNITCLMNINPGEVIRSIFYNHCTESIFTASAYIQDSPKVLLCRSTAISELEAGCPDQTEFLFNSECLSGFVEYEEENRKLITESNNLYKIWDMRTYQHLYDIFLPNVEDLITELGILALVCKITAKHIVAVIFDIETGTLIDKVLIPLLFSKSETKVFLFSDRLLCQENDQFRIIDLFTHQETSVGRGYQGLEFSHYIRSLETLVMFNEQNIYLWNKGGVVLKQFDYKRPKFGVYLPEKPEIIIYLGNMDQETERGELGLVFYDLANDERWTESIPCGSSVSFVGYFYDRRELYIGNQFGYVDIWT